MMSIDEAVSLTGRLERAHPGDADVFVACRELLRLMLAARPSIEAIRPWEADTACRGRRGIGAGLRARFEIRCQAFSASSNALPSFRSCVSKPSVNQP